MRYSLSNNKITSAGAKILFDSLKKDCCFIERIILNENKIGDECMDSLGEYLDGNIVTIGVYLAYNEISNIGIESLLHYFSKNNALKEFRVHGNKKINGESVNSFRNLIKNSIMEDINIWMTSIFPANIFNKDILLNCLKNGNDKIVLNGQ